MEVWDSSPGGRGPSGDIRHLPSGERWVRRKDVSGGSDPRRLTGRVKVSQGIQVA